MKQGTQFVLPVEIGMSLDEISRIEFVSKQKSCKGFPAIKSNVFEPKHQQRKTDWPAEWTDGDQRDCNERYMI